MEFLSIVDYSIERARDSDGYITLDNTTLSFKQLFEHSRKLAHFLITKYPDEVVPLYFERHDTFSFIAAIFGCFYAHKVGLPLTKLPSKNTFTQPILTHSTQRNLKGSFIYVDKILKLPFSQALLVHSFHRHQVAYILWNQETNEARQITHGWIMSECAILASILDGPLLVTIDLTTGFGILLGLLPVFSGHQMHHSHKDAGAMLAKIQWTEATHLLTTSTYLAHLAVQNLDSCQWNLALLEKIIYLSCFRPIPHLDHILHEVLGNTGFHGSILAWTINDSSGTLLATPSISNEFCLDDKSLRQGRVELLPFVESGGTLGVGRTDLLLDSGSFEGRQIKFKDNEKKDIEEGKVGKVYIPKSRIPVNVDGPSIKQLGEVQSDKYRPTGWIGFVITWRTIPLLNFGQSRICLLGKAEDLILSSSIIKGEDCIFQSWQDFEVSAILAQVASIRCW